MIPTTEQQHIQHEWTAYNAMDGYQHHEQDIYNMKMNKAETQYYQPAYQQSGSYSELSSQLSVTLCQSDLWKQFHREGTEMILTKDGRRIFPGLRIKVDGMDPRRQYCVYLDAVSMDGHRYKFQDGEWMIAGKGDPQPPRRMSFHPDSPSLGSKWMKKPISFHKVKLSNSVLCKAKNALILNSMHRYQIRIHIVECADLSMAHLVPSQCTIFNETSFVTVTAYQNHEVTKLKIANNPYAKGFRKDGARGMRTLDENETEIPAAKRVSVDNQHMYKGQPQQIYQPQQAETYPEQNEYLQATYQQNFVPQPQYYESGYPHVMPPLNSIHYDGTYHVPQQQPFEYYPIPDPHEKDDLLRKIWNDMELKSLNDNDMALKTELTNELAPYDNQALVANAIPTEFCVNELQALPPQQHMFSDEGYCSPTCVPSPEEYNWLTSAPQVNDQNQPTVNSQ